MVQLIFDSPMISDQRQHACWGRLAHGKTAQSIDQLMLNGACLENASSSLEAKDLLNTLPLLGKPGDFDQDYT